MLPICRCHLPSDLGGKALERCEYIISVLALRSKLTQSKLAHIHCVRARPICKDLNVVGFVAVGALVWVFDLVAVSLLRRFRVEVDDRAKSADGISEVTK